MTPELEILNQNTKRIAKELTSKEGELLESLTQVERVRLWEILGYNSLFYYCVNELNLSSSQAYVFGGVARKSLEVPEMKNLIQEGKLHMTNARKIVPVISNQNKETLLQKAQALSSRELEKALVIEFPKEIPRERIRPLTQEYSELKVAIPQELEIMLKKSQDILSSKVKKPVTLQEVLLEITKDYLKNHDPRRKAEKAKAREEARQVSQLSVVPPPQKSFDPLAAPSQKNSPSLVARLKNKVPSQKTRPPIQKPRMPIQTQTRHELNLRDDTRCTHIYVNGQRCTQTRWLQVHHRRPVSQGGNNNIHNLETLCFSHHRFQHYQMNTNNPPRSEVRG